MRASQFIHLPRHHGAAFFTMSSQDLIVFGVSWQFWSLYWQFFGD
jgi:hypothetical protein